MRSLNQAYIPRCLHHLFLFLLFFISNGLAIYQLRSPKMCPSSLSIRPFVHLLNFSYILWNDWNVLILHILLSTYFLPCLFENQWNVDKDKTCMKMERTERVSDIVIFRTSQTSKMEKVFYKNNSWLLADRVLNMPLVIIQIIYWKPAFLECYLSFRQ